MIGMMIPSGNPTGQKIKVRQWNVCIVKQKSTTTRRNARSVGSTKHESAPPLYGMGGHGGGELAG